MKFKISLICLIFVLLVSKVKPVQHVATRGFRKSFSTTHDRIVRSRGELRKLNMLSKLTSAVGGLISGSSALENEKEKYIGRLRDRKLTIDLVRSSNSRILDEIGKRVITLDENFGMAQAKLNSLLMMFEENARSLVDKLR